MLTKRPFAQTRPRRLLCRLGFHGAGAVATGGRLTLWGRDYDHRACLRCGRRFWTVSRP